MSSAAPIAEKSEQKSEKSEKPEKPEKPENPEISDKAEKPEKKRGLFRRLWNLPREATPAGCASWLLALFLGLLVLTTWILFLLDPNHIPWRHAMSWPRIFLQLGLVVLIPTVLYQALRLWLEGDTSTYPDIDYAWQAGIDALKQHGMSLKSAPLFLILGSCQPRQERALIRAAGLTLRVRGIPEGPAPIHWFANPDGIYVFCSEIGWTSKLAVLLEKKRQELGDADLSGGAGPLPAMTVSRVVPGTRTVSSRPVGTETRSSAKTTDTDPGRGTIMLDQYVADVQAQVDSTDVERDEEVGFEEEQTEMINLAGTRDDAPAVLTAQESAEQLQRLHYFCQLLRRARAPLCPLNGLLTLIPFEVLQARPREAEELQRAVRNDLAMLQSQLHVRCPVTAMVVGMQSERGFREIVRRVGRERAAGQRFGRKFDVRIVATSEQLTNLCVHIGGVFEDWIHTLFREAGALSRPGNTRLYSLLCKIRVNMLNSLRELLLNAFGYEEKQRDLEEPVAFSGCYFAATGESEDQQAFVKGVFDKLTEEQEQIEWTAGARRANRRYQRIAMLNLALAGLVLISLVTKVITQNWLPF
jgi:hypothetical protein